MEIRNFCTKDTPEREKIGGHRGGCLGKKGNKKRAIATNCYSPFGCHYLQDIMLVLLQLDLTAGLFDLSLHGLGVLLGVAVENLADTGPV